jgi:hypothetical protein
LGPFFERFFILGGPRGTRQKKLQNLDPREVKLFPFLHQSVKGSSASFIHFDSI